MPPHHQGCGRSVTLGPWDLRYQRRADRRIVVVPNGRHPSLTDLDEGDLKYGIDFRNVYASVLQNWLKTPSKPVLGRQFEPMPIIRA